MIVSDSCNHSPFRFFLATFRQSKPREQGSTRAIPAAAGPARVGLPGQQLVPLGEAVVDVARFVPPARQDREVRFLAGLVPD